MEAIASAKYLRGSAQKARLVIDLIRGRNVNEALHILRFTNKRAAQNIDKCLRSAIANATDLAEKANIAVDPDDLWVKTACVDMGPTKRRFRTRPAPQGRAYRERRHYCHVTIEISSEVGGPVKVSHTRKVGGAAAAPRAKAKAEPVKVTPLPAAEEVKPVIEEKEAVIEETPVVEVATPTVETVEEAIPETTAETVEVAVPETTIETVETTVPETTIETVEAAVPETTTETVIESAETIASDENTEEGK